MSKFKKMTSKIAILTIGMLVAFTISLILTVSNGISTVAAEVDSVATVEAKIFSHATIDEDFDDSSVLIVMDKRFGGINKRYDKNFFGEFPKKAIYDLTYISGDIASNRNIDKDNFNQIIQIKLTERSKENVLSVIRQIEKIDGVLSAGPNYYDCQAALPPNSGGTRYLDLWGMHGDRGIQAEEAWNFTTGNRNTLGGRNAVRVGVIDSGLDAHPDLNANIVAEGGDFVNMISVPNNIPSSLRADGNGHGTHVAGTIAAAGTNANGVVGAVWNVQLIPLQVANAAGRWPIDAVTRAITWAINNNVDVINYSGGGTTDDATRRAAIGNFQGLFVCAAGNNDRSNENNTGTNRLYYPSDYSRNQTFSGRVISVGAIMANGNRPTVADWGFADPPANTQPQGSNFGATSVTVFAPGDGILSTQSIARGSLYENKSGTSMATPMVTGSAALMFSIYADMNSTLTRAQKAAAIKTAIINNAVTNDAGTPLNGLCVANGRLNTFRAVSSIAFTTTNVGSNNIRIVSLQTNLRPLITGELVIPDTINNRTVTEIGSSAFASAQMSQISIPASVTSIASNAFENCTSLTIVTLSNNLTSIGSYAFKKCTSLSNISIPNSVTSIGFEAFRNCPNLTDITIPPNVTSIADNTFKDCTGLISVSIPNIVTSIGSSAFENCYNLTNIVLPSSLTTIGSKAFQYCKSVINLTIPSSVTSIGSNAFLNCIGLGIAACMINKNVLYITVPNLITKLKESMTLNQLTNYKKKFISYDLVILDELGYITFDKQGSELLFNLLSMRNETKSIIITTNLAFNRWQEIFNDPTLTAAMVDRLTHKAHVINIKGDSYRLKETMEWLNS